MARFKLGFPANPPSLSRWKRRWQINMHFMLLITIIDLILFTLDSRASARFFPAQSPVGLPLLPLPWGPFPVAICILLISG